MLEVLTRQRLFEFCSNESYPRTAFSSVGQFLLIVDDIATRVLEVTAGVKKQVWVTDHEFEQNIVFADSSSHVWAIGDEALTICQDPVSIAGSRSYDEVFVANKWLVYNGETVVWVQE